MQKKAKSLSFNDVLAVLGQQQFDVSPATEGANPGGSGRADAKRVSKYGCAAVIAPTPAGAVSPALLLHKPGYVLGGAIAIILDRGYQKFLRTAKLEIPATAAYLRALHDFTLELNRVTGEMTLFNEALGTTSDKYEYDRVAGRPDQPIRDF